MPHSTCSVDDCEAVTGVKGTARGLCSKHYNRLLRNGDPLIRTKRQVIATCTIPNCGKPHDAKGLCSAHLTNLRRHGDPLHRKRGEIRHGKKICLDCAKDLPVEDYYSQGVTIQSRCRWCASDLAKAYRKQHAERHRRQYLDQAKKRAGARRDASRRRRALRRAGAAERVESRVVLDRDEWNCRLCYEQIPMVVLWPHPLSPSLDHIVPLVAGGLHSYANIQASHLICNMRKGAKVAA